MKKVFIIVGLLMGNWVYAQVDTLVVIRIQSWAESSPDPWNDTLVSFVSCDGGNTWNGPFLVDTINFLSADFGLGATVDKYGHIVMGIFAETTSTIYVPQVRSGLIIYQGKVQSGCTLTWDYITTILKEPFIGSCRHKYYDEGAVGVVYKDIGGTDYYLLYASGFCTSSGGEFVDGRVFMSNDLVSWTEIDTVNWPWGTLSQDNDGSITMFGDSVYIVDWGAGASPRKYSCRFNTMDLIGCGMSIIDTVPGSYDSRYVDIVRDPSGEEWILVSQQGTNARLYHNGSYCFTFEYSPGNQFIINGEHAAELAASKNGYLYAALWRDNDNSSGGGTPTGTVYDSTIILRCNYQATNCCNISNWQRLRGIYGWGDRAVTSMSIVTLGETTLGYDDELGIKEKDPKAYYDGKYVIVKNYEGEVKIYNLSGALMEEGYIKGEGKFRLPKGVYIISVKGAHLKVIVR